MGYSAGAAIRLLREYLPPKRIAGAPTVEELDLRFRRTVWFVGFAVPLAGIVFFGGTHAILLNLNRYLAVIEGPALFRVLPERVIWNFLPRFGAPCLAWEITRRIWLLFGSREEVELYSYWSDFRSGFQSTNAFRILALFIVLPIGIATIFALPVHTTFHENEIRIRSYASTFASNYAYSAARHLITVAGYLDRNGAFHSNSVIVIVFADGHRWSSADLQDPGNHINPDLLDFLETKTGLPLERKNT
jgi:hypothetical protein